MQFSERMAHIKPSATLTINAKALELKSQGVDVTSLAIGEPNFPTPPQVCAAAKHRRGIYPLHRRARHPAPAGSHRRLL